VILRAADGGPIAEMIDIGFPHTYEFIYGAPEYRGNRDLLGWEYTVYDGDVLPRGWTRKEIEEPDPAAGAQRATAHTARTPLERLVALAPLASPEVAHGIVARSGGTLSGLRAELAPVIDYIEGNDGP
jgi:hypothetical protein